MTDFIRRLVSGPKARFRDHELGLDLDLVYVTDHVIIMGYPASGIEGLYRNRREDAKKFLDHRHGKNYWVFNFCPIRENSYEKSAFEGRVTRFPFPDHHAPPLALLPLAAREMHAWLDGSPDRVAVLHCKAGKGRSGTMACTYLLTLESPPTAPSLNRSLSAAERAKLHANEAITKLPEDDLTLEPTTLPTTSHTKPALIHPTKHQIPSDTAGIVNDGPTSLVDESSLIAPPSNLEKSFIDSLKGVLDLHTARRMKPADDPESPNTKQKKQRQGVSIPSQRRWLYYWALLLAGDAPKDVLNHIVKNGKEKGEVGRSRKSSVKVTRIQVRMHDGSAGVARGVVRATNVVLDKANSIKSRSGSGDTNTSTTSLSSKDKEKAKGKEKEKEKIKNDPNELWASIARYDDELIDLLEKWEAWTRHETSIGKHRDNSKTMDAGDIQHELDELFSSSGEWDKGKMVRNFAKFGLRGAEDESVTLEEGSTKSKIQTHTLRLVNDKRWNAVKDRGSASPESRETNSTGLTSGSTSPELKALEKDMVKFDIPISEAASVDDFAEARENQSDHAEEELEGLVVDASRELRIKLYVGKVFIGWFWFIPSFHMPQSPPATGKSNLTTTRTTFHLTRKDVDFALGLGKAIIDIDVDMEWVPPLSAGDIPASKLDALFPVKTDARADSLEDTEVKGKIGAVLQAVAGGNSESFKDAVRVGQATDI